MTVGAGAAFVVGFVLTIRKNLALVTPPSLARHADLAAALHNPIDHAVERLWNQVGFPSFDRLVSLEKPPICSLAPFV